MQLTKLEEQFKTIAVIRGGVFLLRPKDAIRFVEACRDAGVGIGGLEGFKVEGDRIQPLQEHSVDYCGSDRKNHEASLTFLSSREGKDIWFEVVADDRKE
ncbi:MAG: hypothetical protein DWQ01_09165 [Planctomycetota bacterium]|nr:MAG: hypothetical protein DWQ01_09165 [Planctomycetota bacterium]